jgi:AcrR family transcriptional regulator
MTPTHPIAPRERLLKAADDLFHRYGIRGVGVEAIAEAADTNKMTLYRHFPSKDDLVTEWIRGIVAEREAIWVEIEAKHPGDPRGQLTEWSERVAHKLSELDKRGAPLMNSLAELPEKDHPARRVIEAHKMREHKRILHLCREAGFPEPELRADQFFFLLEGAHSCVQCIGLKRVGEQLVRTVRAWIDASSRPATDAATVHRASK